MMNTKNSMVIRNNWKGRLNNNGLALQAYCLARPFLGYSDCSSSSIVYRPRGLTWMRIMDSMRFYVSSAERCGCNPVSPKEPHKR